MKCDGCGRRIEVGEVYYNIYIGKRGYKRARLRHKNCQDCDKHDMGVGFI